MKLSDYISLTLEEIAKGARKADHAYKAIGAGGVLAETSLEINGIPHIKKIGFSDKHNTYKPIINVDFKVSVEVEEGEEVNGAIGGSLKVIAANKEERGSVTNRTSHQVSFSIPVLYPSEKK